jgi:hypothetical protein
MRSVWKHEASDFTPWLCQHLSELGEALGMDLELVEREADCGEFSLDVLARDLGSGKTVIIENQLTATDHDHLGKLLTYAAGFDAGAIIWVAPSFRDEHRRALEWLNQRTDSTTHVFGVVVEVLRIDESLPAYRFTAVVEPNEWQKGSLGGEKLVSERGEAYRQFFQALIDELRTKHHFTAAKVGQPQNWYTFPSGTAGLSYGTSFASGGHVRVELYIDRGSVEVNKGIFDHLQGLQSQIESAFGAGLEWERLDGKRASRVAYYFPGSIDMTPTELASVRTEIISRLLSLKAVINPHLPAALKAGGAAAPVT